MAPNSRPTDYGALEQRVYSTETGLRALGETMSAGFADLRNQIAGISKEFSERGRAPWGVILTGIGVSVSIIIAVGGLAYWPVLSAQQKAEGRIEQVWTRLDTIAASYVSRAENDRLRNEDKDRAAIVRQQIYDDLKQLTEAVNNISRTYVPRVEAEAITRLQEKLADERQRNNDLRMNHHTATLDKLVERRP